MNSNRLTLPRAAELSTSESVTIQRPRCVLRWTRSCHSTVCRFVAFLRLFVGRKLPANAAEDSYNMLPALLGQTRGPIRQYVLQQRFGGARWLAIRHGEWKYLDHKGSGGNRYETHPLLKGYLLPDTEPDAPGQLYNLETDPGETTNVALEHPEIVKELKSKLEEFKESVRSAP